jgi:PKD repeat protein
MVNFTDQSQGTIDAYAWDFDHDGIVDSTAPGNQTFTFQTEGTFPATLIVSSGGVQSAPYSVDITVNAALTVPNVVDSLPVLPDLSTSASALASTFRQGASLGRLPTAFSIAGDEFFTTPGILTPFASPGGYTLGTNSDLQGVVTFYSLDTTRSFARSSAAVNTGWTAANLVNQPSLDAACVGATPLQCELTNNSPAVILVNVGYYDALNGTPPATFRSSLDQIIQGAQTSGTIPVLLTVPTNAGLNPETVNAINNEILGAAASWQVPVLNTGRLVNELQQTVSPNGPGYLDDAGTYEVNALNLYLLRTLDSVLDTAAPGTVQ